jgi:hypothetical protein
MYPHAAALLLLLSLLLVATGGVDTSALGNLELPATTQFAPPAVRKRDPAESRADFIGYIQLDNGTCEFLVLQTGTPLAVRQ